MHVYGWCSESSLKINCSKRKKERVKLERRGLPEKMELTKPATKKDTSKFIFCDMPVIMNLVYRCIMHSCCFLYLRHQFVPRISVMSIITFQLRTSKLQNIC